MFLLSLSLSFRLSSLTFSLSLLLYELTLFLSFALKLSSLSPMLTFMFHLSLFSPSLSPYAPPPVYDQRFCERANLQKMVSILISQKIL